MCIITGLAGCLPYILMCTHIHMHGGTHNIIVISHTLILFLYCMPDISISFLSLGIAIYQWTFPRRISRQRTDPNNLQTNKSQSGKPRGWRGASSFRYEIAARFIIGLTQTSLHERTCMELKSPHAY